MCLAKVLQTQGWDVAIADRNEFKIRLAEHIGIRGIPTTELHKMSNSFQLTVEATGAEPLFKTSIDLAKRSGAVLWLGNIQADLHLKQKQVSSVLRKELVIRGSWNSNYQRGDNDDWSKALAFISENSWLSHLVTHRIALTDVPATLEKLFALKQNHEPHDMLKAVITM